jgi:multidrug efflux system outer membrane protein
MSKKIAAVVVPLLLLAACRSSSTYRKPTVTVPDTFRGAPAQETAAGEAASLADLKWFEVFQDENLQELVRAAYARNHDLRDAGARIEAARANFGIAQADRLPSVGGAGDLTTLRFSNSGNFPLPPGVSQKRTFGGVALNLLSFEVDIWGRLRKASDAAKAEILAAEETRKALMTTVLSEVAGGYFNLLALDAELEIARRTLLTREESLQVITVREKRGLATMLDVRQAEQLVFTAAQAVPQIEQQIEQTENRISLLLARHPGPIPRGRPLIEQQQPPAVPAGLPSALLARRPDILAVEHSLVAADARIGVARAAYFPRISLTGFLGSQSDQLTNLFTPATGAWQFIPQVSQPIFTGGRIGSNVKLAQAQEQLTLIQYEKVIQTAFREVSDALVQYRKTREIRTQQESLVSTLKDRSRLSYIRYRGGVDTLLNALDADRDLFDAELGLTQTRRDELLALVQLYKALGGGWQQ